VVKGKFQVPTEMRTPDQVRSTVVVYVAKILDPVYLCCQLTDLKIVNIA
jgi:hypothetical protein